MDRACERVGAPDLRREITGRVTSGRLPKALRLASQGEVTDRWHSSASRSTKHPLTTFNPYRLSMRPSLDIEPKVIHMAVAASRNFCKSFCTLDE